MNSSQRCKAFTLIELVIVVLILGVLAGVATPRFIGMYQGAAEQATITQILAIFQAAEAHYIQHGEWPQNVPNGVLPTELQGMLPGRVFNQPTPIGGEYDWNGTGTTMPTYGVSITPGVPNSIKVATDTRFDDGNLRTGWITALPGGYLNFELAPR